jgi:hypothetical protein
VGSMGSAEYGRFIRHYAKKFSHPFAGLANRMRMCS